LITELGIVAGDIWHFLDEHKQSTLAELLAGMDKPRDIVLMSLGWLAREGHVKLEQPEGEEGFKVELRK
jgi:hypothetical protein